MMSLYDFQISEDDYLPHKICDCCLMKLEELYEWKNRCIKTDAILRSYANSLRTLTVIESDQVI